MFKVGDRVESTFKRTIVTNKPLIGTVVKASGYKDAASGFSEHSTIQWDAKTHLMLEHNNELKLIEA